MGQVLDWSPCFLIALARVVGRSVVLDLVSGVAEVRRPCGGWMG